MEARGSRWERHGAGVVGYAAILALVGVLCALVYRGQCLDPGPPVGSIEAGTPRAGLCGAVRPDWPFALAAASVLLVCALAYRYGPGRRGTIVLASLLGLAQLVLPIWAGNLDFAYTI